MQLNLMCVVLLGHVAGHGGVSCRRTSVSAPVRAAATFGKTVCDGLGCDACLCIASVSVLSRKSART